MSIDTCILRSVIKGKEQDYCVWESCSPIVVIGRGSREGNEIFRENCDRDGVPVFRRKTGGGAVVLSPGMLVFSLAKRVGKEFHIREYAKQVNDIVIEFFLDIGVSGLSTCGISDVCMGNRKIMGSGMYRRKKILFFQGSMLVDPDLSLMDRYLKIPPKQPEYRKERTHRDFVTTLRKEGVDIKTTKLIPLFDSFLAKNISKIY
ncbi:MAG: lipoate--protein ligase family protein [Candidatus Eremiobacteraeota bacterium]|nr:lipoate--protein ligase family protein [Candidatus Eremiobacteraeota bacterium]